MDAVDEVGGSFQSLGDSALSIDNLAFEDRIQEIMLAGKILFDTSRSSPSLAPVCSPSVLVLNSRFLSWLALC